MSMALVTRLRELEQLVAALQRSVGAIEGVRAQAEHRRMAGLRAQAGARRAQGEELRAEIRGLLEAHRGPRPLKASAVLTMIKRERRPSLRRVQELVRELTSATPDGSSACAETRHIEAD